MEIQLLWYDKLQWNSFEDALKAGESEDKEKPNYRAIAGLVCLVDVEKYKENEDFTDIAESEKCMCIKIQRIV